MLLAGFVLAAPAALAADPVHPTSSAPPRNYSGDPDYPTMEKSVVRVIGVFKVLKTENGQPVVGPDGQPVVLTGISYGSGVVVGTGPSGYRYIATNVHVIANTIQHGGKILIAKPGADEKTDQLIEVNPILAQQSTNVDLAFLEVQDTYFEPIKVADTPPTAGQSVAAIGFPAVADKSLGDARAPTLTTGNVATVVKKTWASSGGAPFDIIQHSSTINPGNSGGGLFDFCGALVGINTQDTGHRTIQAGDNEVDVAAAPGVYYAIGSTEIAHLAPEKVQIATASGACKSGGPVPPPPPGNSTSNATASAGEGDTGPNKTLIFAGIAALGAIVLGGVAAFALRAQAQGGRRRQRPARRRRTASPCGGRPADARRQGR